MGISNFASKLRAIFFLGATEPGLLPLALRLKREQKTFLSYAKLLSLVRAFKLVQRRTNEPMQIAEFGVGRGGSAMLLGWLVNRYGGELTLFDLFGRIPPPTASDGQAAKQRYADILSVSDGKDYYGNLDDLQARITTEISEILDLKHITFVPGRYEDSLPTRPSGECYHIAHVDCDWYASTKAVLAYLQTRVYPVAVLQFDDYGYWSGSKQAVDETEWLRGRLSTKVDDALVIDLFQPEYSETARVKTAQKS